MAIHQNDWDGIRRFYAWAMPIIMSGRPDEWAIDPYAWEESGFIRMTPIESWLWADIRQNNAILYPQVPIGRAVVDFANPVAKVAIECDGAAYHTDKAKDEARDAWLRRQGWSVHRITGKQCRTDFDDEAMTRGAADLFIRDICEQHGIRRQSGPGVLVQASDLMAQVKAEFARAASMPRRGERC